MTAGAHWAGRPGHDLAQQARALRRVHDDAMTGHTTGGRPRDLVGRSWSRVLAAGLRPDDVNGRDPAPWETVEQRRAASPLGGVIDDLTGVMAGLADASQLLLVVTDADGVVLWREGSSRVRRTADHLGFSEGATWTETTVGTNAIGTALAEEAPVQLFSAEHFEQAQHPWFCTAHPVHDPRTGDLLGIVDVSGPAMTLHPAIGALVETGVRLAQSQLWRRHQQRLEALRGSMGPALAGAGGPTLVVDDHGWVAASVGCAAPDRVTVPRAGVPSAVPGVGAMLPERVADGWLLRAVGSSRRLRLIVRGGSDPRVEVTGPDGVWVRSLTPRHEQIVRLVADAGAQGLSAAALSRLLHGDDQHVVATRAEVSRLRRVLGATLLTQPYRLDPDVEVTVVG